ncbi:MAG TPA: EAL domain-containing protein [Steroidobacteraceae bacterium]|nr:EAL domain-containing protein [Steroidobacteraceae bacterium]
MNVTTQTGPFAIIADDEELGRLLMSESMAGSGLEPLAFDNGLAALDAALSREVAIILLDVDMPGMDGYSVCRRLRAEPRLATVPIVMVTGHEDAAAIGHAFEAGATDFISKPVNWALLPRRIEYILRNAAAAHALAERVSQVNTLVEAIPDALWVVTPDGNIRWSPNAGPGKRSQAVGRTDGSTDGTSAAAVLAPPERLPEALESIRQTALDGLQRKLAYREDDPSGLHRSFELRFNRREGGDVVVLRQDTSERTAAAEHIERLAYFDPLTSLPNRQRCIETAERLFGEAATSQQSVAVVYLDLNSFKRVNDAFGHSVGDAVLRMVAGKLARTLERFQDGCEHLSVARFGGDEFVILIKNAGARALAMQIADACAIKLKEPIEYNGLEFFSGPSIGLAVYPEDGPDVTTVLKHADTAMYQAKTGATGSVAVYCPAMSSRLRDWLELEGRLRRAVQTDLLGLQYQPKFRLSDNRVVGVEALIRWCDADHGNISPVRFIEIAEDSGLIIDLGSWVVRAACRQLRKWLDRGIAVPVAVNVSAKELLYGDPARVVETETAAFGVPPSLIEIEITESLLVKDSATVRSALEKLRQLGCRIALDDFGTGYSSLAYITRFPPDRIKIDKAFVNNVDRSSSDGAVASAILSLGKSLDLIVTAEGIERTGQLEWLRARGCNEVQGFLLSRPLSAQDLENRYLLTVEAQKPDARSGIAS